MSKYTCFIEQVIDDIVVVEVMKHADSYDQVINSETDLIFLIEAEIADFHIIEGYYYTLSTSNYKKDGFQKVNLQKDNDDEININLNLSIDEVWIQLNMERDLTETIINKLRNNLKMLKIYESITTFINASKKYEEKYERNILEKIALYINLIVANDKDSKSALEEMKKVLKIKTDLSKSKKLEEELKIIRDSVKLLKEVGLSAEVSQKAMKELLQIDGIGIVNLSRILHAASPKKYPLYSEQFYELLVFVDYIKLVKSFHLKYFEYSSNLEVLLKRHLEFRENDKNEQYTKVSCAIKKFKLTNFLRV